MIRSNAAWLTTGDTIAGRCPAAVSLARRSARAITCAHARRIRSVIDQAAGDAGGQTRR